MAVYNRSTEKVDNFDKWPWKGKAYIGCKSIGELVENLERPLQNIADDSRPEKLWII